MLCVSAKSWRPTTTRPIRDGPAAVELAERADNLSGGKNATVLDILAAAYAEAGRFPEAVETAQVLWPPPRVIPPSSAMQEKLKLYRAGSAYHEVSPTSYASPDIALIRTRLSRHFPRTLPVVPSNFAQNGCWRSPRVRTSSRIVFKSGVMKGSFAFIRLPLT